MIQNAINRTLSLAGILVNMRPKNLNSEEKSAESKETTPVIKKGEENKPSPLKQAETMANKSNEALLAERERFLKTKNLLKNLSSEEE